MWSGHVHRAYAPRRTIAAENKRDARQKSAAYQPELDPGLDCSGVSMTAVDFRRSESAATVPESSRVTGLCRAQLVSVAGPPNGLGQEKFLLAQAWFGHT
jgi:hypothetical protein